MGNSLAHPGDAGKMSGGSSVPFGDLVGRHGVAAAPADPFRRLWDLGYRQLVPIIPPGAELSDKSHLKAALSRRDDRGKIPGRRGQDGRWFGFQDWQKRETTEADIAEWAGMGAGAGIVADAGLYIVDIDARDPRTAEFIEAEAIRILGPSPLRIGAPPKRALLYQGETPATFQVVTFQGSLGEDRVEILARPRQIVAHGIHPKTGKPYEWVRPLVPRDELTSITRERLDMFLETIRAELPEARRKDAGLAIERTDVNQDRLKGDVELVRKAVAALPNTRALFPSYDDMVRVGEAIHAATIDDPTDGAEIFDEWASRWEGGDYDSGVTDARWSTFRAPHAVGADYLFDLSHKHSAGAFNIAERWHEPPSNVVSLFPETPEPEAPARFAFESFDALASVAFTQPSRPLIRGLLDQGAMSVLYGESNSGKTFVALDMAFHVAAGLAWNDARVTQAPVVYVAAEGGLGFAKRITALRQRYGSPPAGHFHALRSPVNLLRADADLAPLIASLRALEPRPGFVLLDTLSRVMAGGDENASTDMGSLVRNLDAIRAATGAHLMVVHHTGKNLSKGARGHSLLRAATDTEIEIANGMLRATKQRDIEKNLAVSFALQSVVLGVDDEGDTITSATVRILPTVVVEPAEIEESAAEIEQRERVALAVYRALDGETTANIGTSRKRLNEEFAAAGLKVGASLPMVRDKVSSALASPVTIEVDGQIVRIEARKIGAGGKAPWSISALRVPGEAHSGSSEAGNEPIDEGAETLESERKSTVFD